MIKKISRVTKMVFCLLLVNSLANAGTITFLDDFEAQSIDPFWTTTQEYGTVALSSDQAHSGSQSAKFSSTSGGQRNILLKHEFPNVIEGNVSVWFYDTAPGQQTLYSFLTLYNSTVPWGESGYLFGLGVNDWDGSNYFFGGPEQLGDGRTSIPRTVGWHKFEIKISSTGGQMFIDDILVHSFTGDFGFNAVQLSLSGPDWRPNATYYFDDFRLDAVYNVAPNDFNGDGHSDILWKKDDGKYIILTMDESGETGMIPLSPNTATWSVEGVGDFNGDGKADILWRVDNGRYLIWTMDASGKIGDILPSPITAAWSAEEVGDFNGDGKADILWKKNNGEYIVFTMDESGETGIIRLPAGRAAWNVAGSCSSAFTKKMLKGKTFYLATVNDYGMNVNKVEYGATTRLFYSYDWGTGTYIFVNEKAYYVDANGVLQVDQTIGDYTGTLNIHLIGKATTYLAVEAFAGTEKWADRLMFETEEAMLEYVAPFFPE